MSTKTTPVARQAFARRNQYNTCAAPSCHSGRKGISKYCNAHRLRVVRYGHPHGQPLPAKLIHQYRDRMVSFLERHRETDQVIAALQVVDDMLMHGLAFGAGRSAKAVKKELRRLTDDGVTAEEALSVIGAVWLIAHHERHMLPDDARLAYALSNSLLKARPHYAIEGWAGGERVKVNRRPPGAGVRRVVGQYVRATLGVFLFRVVEAIDRQERKQRSVKEALSRPFAVD